MNKRDIIFEYILQHGIDNYAMKNMLHLRRAELERREPFFQTVEINGLCRLLCYMTNCNFINRHLTEQKAFADKGMLCALIFNIVNRLGGPLVLSSSSYKGSVTITLRGSFNYTPNTFELKLINKLRAASIFYTFNEKGVLILKFMRSNSRPTAHISAEEMLLNPLSDAYIFLNNI